MAHFDEWVTDPAVKRTEVVELAAKLAEVGQTYLGQFAVWATSGTTGSPGFVLHDRVAHFRHEAGLVTNGSGGHFLEACFWMT